MSTLLVYLALNDPRNGMPSGYVQMIAVRPWSDRDAALALDCCRGDWSPVGRILPIQQKVRISRKVYPILSYRPWAGSWYWVEVTMAVEVGLSLLNDLRASGHWQLDSGLANWWDRWESGEPFDSDWLRAQS